MTLADVTAGYERVLALLATLDAAAWAPLQSPPPPAAVAGPALHRYAAARTLFYSLSWPGACLLTCLHGQIG